MHKKKVNERLYREQKIYCKDYMEVQIFPVFKKQKGRGRKAKPTEETQRKLNEKNAELSLRRKVHSNFTEQDYGLHLTYEEQPETIEEAKKDMQNFIRRAKRLYKKNGIENLKYLWVIEKGGQSGRVHFHLFISGGVDRTELERTWGKGYANSKCLVFGENGVAGLVHYVVKDRVTYRRWSCSKNLEDPIIKESDYKIRKYDVDFIEQYRDAAEYYERLYPGYVFVSCESERNKINKEVYALIRMYKKDSRMEWCRKKRRDTKERARLQKGD